MELDTTKKENKKLTDTTKDAQKGAKAEEKKIKEMEINIAKSSMNFNTR